MDVYINAELLLYTQSLPNVSILVTILITMIHATLIMT